MVGGILSFSVPLIGHNGQVGDCSKTITVQHYKSGHVAVVSIDHKLKHAAYATEVDHDLRLEQALREDMDKCRIAPTEFGRFARYLPTSTGSPGTVVPLVPGMRVKIERGGGAWDRPAHVGAGTVTFQVLRDGADSIVFGASTRVRNVSPAQLNRAAAKPQDTKGSVTPGVFDATVPADLNPPALQIAPRHWRLFIPTEIGTPLMNPEDTLNPKDQFVFAAASDAVDLDAVANSTLFDECSKKLRCVIFRGHTQVIPEIPVSVQGESMYVAVGTTLGDVITRFTDRSRVSDQELRQLFHQQLVMRRWFGARLFRVDLRLDAGSDWLGLTLRHGDVVRW